MRNDLAEHDSSLGPRRAGDIAGSPVEGFVGKYREGKSFFGGIGDKVRWKTSVAVPLHIQRA